MSKHFRAGTAAIDCSNLSFWSCLLPLLCLLLISPSCREAAKSKEIKLAHALETSHPVHLAMEFLAKRLEEKSGGKLSMQIYPSSQLGSEREMVELLQIGSVGMTKVSAATMESFSPNFKVLGIPYIFKDKDHYYRVLDGSIGKALLTEGEKFWLRGLTYYDAGSRSFYSTNKPINEPKDLQGMKIRVMSSPTAINMVRSFGGAATPISWGELYTALQQGVVDGAENNPPSFYLSRHYEVSKFYSLNEHTMVPDILLISTKVWEDLNTQEKQWLQEAADESAVVQRELWAKAEAEALAEVQKAGVKIVRPPKEPFAEKVESMYEAYKTEPEVYELIQKIQAQENSPTTNANL